MHSQSLIRSCLFALVLTAEMFFTIQARALELAEYGVASWPESGFGNHRAQVSVTGNEPVHSVMIPWRRRDADVNAKAVIVVDPAGKQVANVLPVDLNRDFGSFIFDTSSGPGEYSFYYLPYQLLGMFGSETYLPPAYQQDENWLKNNQLLDRGHVADRFGEFPQAKIRQLQARGPFHSFFPMEVCATHAETEGLKSKLPGEWALFPETRQFEIRMKDKLPQRWIANGPADTLEVPARPGEYLVFQAGVWAAKKALNLKGARFSEFTGASGAALKPDQWTCFNFGGVDAQGNDFTQRIDVPEGRVQALWFGVQLPITAKGEFNGDIEILAAEGPGQKVRVSIKVAGDPLPDGGVSDPDGLSRLQWLNSRRGQEPVVVPPFTAVEVAGNRVNILNREISFGDSGLPTQVTSNGEALLTNPITLHADGKTIDGKTTRITGQNDASVTRLTEGNLGDGIKAEITSKTEFDGAVEFEVRLKSTAETRLSDLALDIPYRKDVATYWMGLGERGGYRKKDLEWKWDIKRITNMIWIGEVHAGMQLKLQDERGDQWGLLDYQQIGLPPAWSNGGKGGASVTETGETVLLRAYCGERTLKAGEPLTLKFRLLVTPFKPLSPNHWKKRVKDLTDGEANIAHIHHSTSVVPFINYPFRGTERLKGYLDHIQSTAKRTNPETGAVEDRGRRGINLYYNLGQLSNQATEIWALRSLPDSVFNESQDSFVYTDQGAIKVTSGGGYPWLQEHLGGGYVPGWRESQPWNGEFGAFCAALVLKDPSRWNNYYAEGIRWLMRDTGFDGLYLDGIGFDRRTMQRAARTMHEVTPDYRINAHQGNGYDFLDQRNSSMNSNMEHLPYLTDLWTGEMFDYNRSADYQLIEISGIPFGVMNEMLENHGGGNAWRGMVFGMNGRFLPGCDEMWKFWDTFGIEKAKMIGYWDKKCPVKPTLPRIKATVYQKPNEALIALAEWPEDDAPAARRNFNVPLIAVGSDVEAQTASFAKFGGDGKVVSASHQTFVKAAALPEGLKISFTCYQSDKPLAKHTARDANIWEDDSVEIFLQPDPAAKEYFKFTGNANGAIFDAGPGGSETTWNWQTSGPPNVAWNGNWNYQARPTPDGWAGEIFIRYADLGMKPPAPGDRIGFNICRGQQRPIPQLSGWSKPGVSFNNSGGFGVITFTSPAEATKEKVVDINELYAPILTRLEIDWKALGMNPAECELYAPALKSFQSERTFGINDEIPIKPAEGMLLWLKQKK